MALWKHFSDYDPARPFVNWAFGFARTEVRRFLRRAHRRAALSEKAVEAVLLAADAHLEMREQQERHLEDCLARLYRKDADGRGCTLEYAVPWALLGTAKKPPRAGDTLEVSWTTHWSDVGGRLWRGQLVELRNASEPPRIHTWERAATWGRAHYR